MDEEGFSPLHYMLLNGSRFECTKFFLAAGADPKVEDPNGLTIEEYAKHHGQEELWDKVFNEFRLENGERLRSARTERARELESWDIFSEGGTFKEFWGMWQEPGEAEENGRIFDQDVVEIAGEALVETADEKLDPTVIIRFRQLSERIIGRECFPIFDWRIAPIFVLVLSNLVALGYF